MKLKIVDMKKFSRSLTIVFVVILFLLFIGFSTTYSKVEVKYKTDYILGGDTIWSIAEKEADENKYFENMDVRSVVKEIKNLNNLENQVLKIGQEIKIPTY